MQGDWETTKDGYDRHMRFVELGSRRILGEINGSNFTREWTAYLWVDIPPKWLGKFDGELAAQDAVMAELRGREPKEVEHDPYREIGMDHKFR